MPPDGNANFSALVYHNLAPLVQPFAGTIAGSAKALPEEQQKAISAHLLNLQPTLFYAYAFSDRIEFASNTEGGPFGLSPANLLGMPNAFELEHILGQGMLNDQKAKPGPEPSQPNRQGKLSSEPQVSDGDRAATASRQNESMWKRRALHTVSRARDYVTGRR